MDMDIRSVLLSCIVITQKKNLSMFPKVAVAGVRPDMLLGSVDEVCVISNNRVNIHLQVVKKKNHQQIY